MKIPDNLFESLETVFGLKIIKYFYADPGSGFRNLFNTDPGSGMVSVIFIVILITVAQQKATSSPTS